MFEMKTGTIVQTEQLGYLLGGLLTPHDIVLLNGELGAGKTTLVRGIVAGSGGIEVEVTSPSYTYLNIYQAKYPVYHLDVYLLDNFEDVYEIGLEELYNKGLIIIEWGGKFNRDMIYPYWEIDILYTDMEDERVIKIKPPKSKIHLIKEVASFGDTGV